jgi:riboflavin synthase
MFTGIIEQVGVVEDVRDAPAGMRLRIAAGPWAAQSAVGSSVCVCGVCLTVARADDRFLDFDVVHETLAKTTLGRKRPGDRVNLERSLRVGDRMDGHFVLGHVDGIAEVENVRTSSGEYVVELRPDADRMPYIVPQGSIAVEGISLTVAERNDETFAVALIPTTLQRTNLVTLRRGDAVNLETDILVRTVIHRLHTLSPTGHLPHTGNVRHKVALR